jgi:hypothetical protein
MALSTYAELQAAIASLLSKTNLTASIPDFIRMCETDVDGRYDLATHRRRICRAEATINAEYELTPTDFLAVQSFRLDTDPKIQLEYIDPDSMERLIHDQEGWEANLSTDFGSSPSPPRYYTIVGTEFRFFPFTTGQSYTAQLAVYERLHPLATADTNWLLEFYPHIYLYGSAIHSAPFLLADERLPVWQGLYEKACQEAARADPFPTAKTKLRTELANLNPRSSAWVVQ